MTNLETEYTIPLRRFWVNVPKYRRSARAINAIKTFIAKHMKVTERDVNNVKLDVYLNNEIWYRGTDNPPSKVKVKAVKEGEIVKVTLSEVPAYVKFLQAKHAKLHKKSEKKEEKAEPKAEQKTEEEKTDEKEKETAVAEANTKVAEAKVKADKHTTKPDKNKAHPVRMALQK